MTASTLHVFGKMLANLWMRRLVGLALFLASLTFVIRTFAHLNPLDSVGLLSDAASIVLLLLSLCYGAMLLLLVSAWAACADLDGRLSHSDQVVIYGRSTLAKYIPGSVLQYGSRQWLGAAKGLPQAFIARASMVEILLHLICAGLVTTIGAAATGLIAAAYGFGAVAFTPFLVWTTARLGGRRALFACAMQTIFFFLFWLLAFSTAALLIWDRHSAALLATVFLVGWLAGFVLPFVPGGLGVREAAIIALGGNLVVPEALIAFTVLMRLLTLGGDLYLYLASYLLPALDTRLNRQASARQ